MKKVGKQIIISGVVIDSDVEVHRYSSIIVDDPDATNDYDVIVEFCKHHNIKLPKDYRVAFMAKGNEYAGDWEVLDTNFKKVISGNLHVIEAHSIYEEPDAIDKLMMELQEPENNEARYKVVFITDDRFEGKKYTFLLLEHEDIYSVLRRYITWMYKVPDSIADDVDCDLLNRKWSIGSRIKESGTYEIYDIIS